MAKSESPSLVSVELEFPVTLNGVAYEGTVEVSEEIALGIADVVNGVKEREAYDAELQAQAAGL